MLRPHPITALDDPRVAGYRNLRERNLRAEGRFITEGALLAERLLGSRFPVESLLVSAESAGAFNLTDEARSLLSYPLRDDVPLYIAPAALLRQIAGFDFHRGVLALACRLPFPAVVEFTQQMGSYIDGQGSGAICANATPLRLIACPATETAENLGLILRSAAAFGVKGVLLPATGADPLSRRCLRQSMGAALTLPIAVSSDLLEDLAALRRSHGFRLIAAVAGNHPGVISLSEFTPPRRTILLVGNEYHGLDAAWLAQCDHLATISLAPGCDSLNVAVATGIFLHHMRNND